MSACDVATLVMPSRYTFLSPSPAFTCPSPPSPYFPYPGWVREMYAWDIAIAKGKVQMLTEDYPRSPLLAQPPADHVMGNGSIAHYTVRCGSDQAGGDFTSTHKGPPSVGGFCS